MSSRETILLAIRSAKPEGHPLPELSLPAREGVDLVFQYKTALEKNGGKFFKLSSVEEINVLVNEQFPDANTICSRVDGVNGNRIIGASGDPHTLSDIDVVILPGMVGVAENAAVWLPGDYLLQRVLPFITQHLILVLKETDIVPTLHEAYNRINISVGGYGVFIAGPSKTADIEQSLVIGAHGARSLMVCCIAE